MTKRNSKENGVQIPFSEQEFIDKWQEWLQYRKERRIANYVPTGLKTTFSKLVKDSNNDFRTAILIIDQSLGNGWQGLFPLKETPNGAPNIPSTTNSSKQNGGGTSTNRIEALKKW